MTRKLPIYISMLVTLISVGTIFFRFVEGWTWLDAYFFTVVTLSTVGYGSLVPATALGKIGTTVLIFFGIGIFAFIVSEIGRQAIRRRLIRIERNRRARKQSLDKTKGPDA